MKMLPQRFFARDTEVVAKELLGKTLVHVHRGQRLSGKIVETEAYIGTRDAACHGFNGRKTKRNASLYLPAGHAYVFMIYGMHFCFNAVTKKAREPEAVLIRALEPLEGLTFMQQKRGVKNFRDFTNGPAKLCQALAIDKRFDGLKLEDKIFIEDSSHTIATSDLVAAPRIGVDYAGEAARWPLRFFLKNSSYVSKK